MLYGINCLVSMPVCVFVCLCAGLKKSSSQTSLKLVGIISDSKCLTFLTLALPPWERVSNRAKMFAENLILSVH